MGYNKLMTKHHQIGKLCQYKSEHKDKVLFTYPLSDEDKHAIEYTCFVFGEARHQINAATCIPPWYYNKLGETIVPDPITYQTPYFINYRLRMHDKIHSFLIIDSLTFGVKIGTTTVSKRTFLKAFFSDTETGSFNWLDADWVEPYIGKETYLEHLKTQLLIKMRQNT